ncbi:MAG: hypothetical protein ACLFPS_05920 [Clostridia bacterium]
MKIIVTIIVLSLLLIGNLGLLYSTYQENEAYKDLLILSSESYSSNEDLGNKYYELATLSYERSEFSETEKNCKLAREYFSDAVQELKATQSKIKREEKVFQIYKDLLGENIKIDENMYEACEWFETASRHYAHYVKDTTPYGDSSLEKGNEAIEEMNKKINAHDDAVRRYNSLLEDYNLELREFLGVED